MRSHQPIARPSGPQTHATAAYHRAIKDERTTPTIRERNSKAKYHPQQSAHSVGTAADTPVRSRHVGPELTYGRALGSYEDT